MRRFAPATFTGVALLLSAACGSGTPAPAGAGTAARPVAAASAAPAPESIVAQGFAAKLINEGPVVLAPSFRVAVWQAAAGTTGAVYADPVKPLTYTAGPVATALPGALFSTSEMSVPASPGYLGRLMVVTIEPGGRGAPHVHGGSETLYVVQGRARLRLADGDHVLLAGQGLSHAAGTAIQDVNDGDVPLVMLAYFVTATGQPFRTDLTAAPAAVPAAGIAPTATP